LGQLSECYRLFGDYITKKNIIRIGDRDYIYPDNKHIHVEVNGKVLAEVRRENPDKISKKQFDGEFTGYYKSPEGFEFVGLKSGNKNTLRINTGIIHNDINLEDHYRNKQAFLTLAKIFGYKIESSKGKTTRVYVTEGKPYKPRLKQLKSAPDKRYDK
jgi:hypothetical protein